MSGASDSNTLGSAKADTLAEAHRGRAFTPPEPDADEVAAFAAQKRRLMAEMFGVEPRQRSTLGKIGHYELLGLLGDGGMGRVYEAYDPSLERKVAIKTLLERASSPIQRARLTREAMAMAKLTHPNVVRVYEIGDAQRGPYIVMELVEGQTLREWLAERERELPELLEAFRGIARGLAAIHDAGLVHRDLKPDNVMIDSHGRVLVMDLGIVKAETEPSPGEGHAAGSPPVPALQTRTGAMLGTPYYMAPEQFGAARIDDAADQYSFCVTLWEAVYGERPVEAESMMELAHAVRGGARREPAHPDRAPRWLRAVLERGLSLDPRARFESMHALIDALTEPPSRWRSGGARALVAGLGLGLAGLGLALWLGADAGPPASAPAAATPSALESASAELEPNEPRRLEHVPSPYELLPDASGLVYVDDHALWLQRFGSTPRQLHEGWVTQVQLTANGNLYFNVASADGGHMQLHRMSPPYRRAEAPLGAVWPFFCVLERQGKVITTAQNGRSVYIFPIQHSGTTPETIIKLEGDIRWTQALACDEANGRFAVIMQRAMESRVSIFELGESTERTGFELNTLHLAAPRFSPTGDRLYYLVDRGRGLQLEGRTLTSERPQTFSALPETNTETVAFSLSPDGRAAVYTQRFGATTRIERWPGQAAAGTVPSWQLTVPTDIGAVAISPDERTLAFVEYGPDIDRGVSRVAIGSEEQPSYLRAIMNVGGLAWSPDGEQLAYIASSAGKLRVWTMAADGTSAAALGTTSSANNSDIAWSPVASILYQPPGVREYTVLDPVSAAERPLYDPEQLRGWSFFAKPAPDRRQVALGWNRPDCGLSLVSLEDGSERILIRGANHDPIGWSSDSRYVYAYPGEAPHRVVRVAVDSGEIEPWLELELEPGEQGYCAAMFRNGDVLCLRDSDQREMWIRDQLVGPRD